MEGLPRHHCLIYDGSPAKMLPVIAAQIKTKLDEHVRCLYLNSPSMVAGIRSYLFAIGVNVPEEVGKGRLILSSDQSQIKNGQFDVDEILQRLENAVNQALSDGYRGIWITGDMTWELGRDRNLNKLVTYEWKLDQLFQKYPALSGLCQYHLGTLSNATVCNALVSHPTIFINQTLTRINPNYLPSDAPIEPVAPSAALSHTVQNLCALYPEEADTN